MTQEDEIYWLEKENEQLKVNRIEVHEKLKDHIRQTEREKVVVEIEKKVSYTTTESYGRTITDWELQKILTEVKENK